MLELAVQYAKERVQFGHPIGSFQAVKHRCADMLVDVEGIRSATWYAAWTISAGDPDASAAASTAKVWSSDAARRVMASGLQVHGGIGFTWEHDLHLYMKRSQFDRVSYGDAAYHRARLAGSVAIPPLERQRTLLTGMGTSAQASAVVAPQWLRYVTSSTGRRCAGLNVCPV